MSLRSVQGGRFSRLPSPLVFTPYMKLFSAPEADVNAADMPLESAAEPLKEGTTTQAVAPDPSSGGAPPADAAPEGFQLLGPAACRGGEAATSFSLGGGGHSLDDCAAACRAQGDCALFVFYTATAYCHLYQNCGEPTPAYDGSTVYVREQPMQA